MKKIIETPVSTLRKRAEVLRHRLRDMRVAHAERPGNLDEADYLEALEDGADALDELVAIL